MANRSLAKKVKSKGPCRVYWGSHGCRKQRGHLGIHFCSRGCWIPDDSTNLYGEDVELYRVRATLPAAVLDLCDADGPRD